MKGLLKSMIVFNILLFDCLYSYAQDSRFTHYTVEDELPSSIVYRVIEDRQGFMWFGTEGGLCRFDGYQFKTYTVKNGLPANDVLELFEDSKGRIWIITFNRKPCYLFNDSIYLFNPDNIFDDFEWQYIKETSGGALWFGSSEQGCIRFMDNKTEAYSVDHKVPLDLTCVAEDIQGKFWFAGVGCGYVEDDSFKFYSLPAKILNQESGRFGVKAQSNGQILGYNRNSIILINDSSYQVIFPNHALPDNCIITTINMSPEGKILLSTDRGAYRITYRDSIEKFEAYMKGIPVNAIFEDDERNLWLTTPRDGIYRLSRAAQQVSNFNQSTGLVSDKINAVEKDPNSGGLILGTATAMVQVIGKERNMTISVGLDNVINKVNDIYLDVRGGCWIGTDYGLFITDFLSLTKGSIRWEKNTDRRLLTSMNQSVSGGNNYLLLGTVKNIYPGNDTAIWLTTNNGLYKIIGDKDSGYSLSKIFYQRLTTVCQDSSGTIWAGRPDGLLKVDEETGNSKPIQDFAGMPINQVMIDESNLLWIATGGFGIYAYKDQSVLHLTAEQGLADDHVNVLTVHDDKLYAGTNKGVSIFTISGRNQSLSDNYSLTTNEGLLSNEITDLKVTSDSLYIATQRGISIVPINVFNNERITPVYLTGIKINERDTAGNEQFTLDYTQNNIEIQFRGLSYKSNKNIRYRYKMDGLDTTWNYTDLTTVRYSYLPPNDYTFNVSAKGRNEQWSDTPVAASFSISPPFWQMLWFRGGVIIIIILMSSGVSYGVTNYLRSKNEMKRKLAESEQKALRAQMNPHFVFNSLYSIQSLINKKDQYGANIYLAKFSELIRMNLEFSKRGEITLAEEVYMLNTYLELESLRFKNKFDYQVNTNDFDMERTKIPSMIIQPFVENSIRHGLLPKEDKGELTISFEKDTGFVRCIVTDNGIGRTKAMEIGKNKISKHNSLGIGITKERLQLFSISGKKGDVIFKDLSPGTEVIIKIPI